MAVLASSVAHRPDVLREGRDVQMHSLLLQGIESDKPTSGGLLLAWKCLSPDLIPNSFYGNSQLTQPNSWPPCISNFSDKSYTAEVDVSITIISGPSPGVTAS